jgi:hypothetical protein
MRAWRKAELVFAALLALALASGSSRAAFEITRIDASAADRTLTVSGDIDLSLNNKVEEAISRGIPLDVELELRLYRERPIIWAQHVATWTIRRRIRYHALSGQYLVSSQKPRPVHLENFTTLRQALHQMGSLNDIEFRLPAPMQKKARYKLETRVELDIESLPPPLRPVAYTSLAWHLDSGWTTWTVQH